MLFLWSCAGTKFESGSYVISGPHEQIYVFPFAKTFVYDQKMRLGEFAEGLYYFINRDSLVLDARFDSLAISYQLFHNAAAINHVNAGFQDSSVVRCPELGRCRVVIFAPPNLYPRARHDSLTTELFDVAGDETILTRVGYNEWYQISIRDTVRVLRAVRFFRYD